MWVMRIMWIVRLMRVVIIPALVAGVLLAQINVWDDPSTRDVVKLTLFKFAHFDLPLPGNRHSSDEASAQEMDGIARYTALTSATLVPLNIFYMRT